MFHLFHCFYSPLKELYLRQLHEPWSAAFLNRLSANWPAVHSRCECDGSLVRSAPCLLTNLPSTPLWPPDPGTVRVKALQPSSVLTASGVVLSGSCLGLTCIISGGWIVPLHWTSGKGRERGAMLCWAFCAWLMSVREIWDSLGKNEGCRLHPWITLDLQRV